MTDISIPWDDGPLAVRLPEGWTLQQTALASLPPAGDDWPDRLAAALNRPEETPPLAKMLQARHGGRVAIVVEDLTRHSPLPEILKVLFRELSHAKVPDESVEIVIAAGMHPAPTPEQVAEKIGPDLAGRIAWRANRHREDGAYRRLGTVRDGPARLDVRVDEGVCRADLRIIVSSVSPHLQAGFGGGYKMLVPGCAHLETICQLHSTAVPRRLTQQVGQPGDQNRMRRLIDAAGAAVDAAGGASFGIQYVLDGNDRPTAIAAGDVATCQRMLAKTCAAGSGVPIEAPADVVIASAAPRDFDLWQAFKAVANTCWAVRPNGVLIVLARCPEGANIPTLHLPITPTWVRRIIRLLGADALAGLAGRFGGTRAADAAFFIRMAMRIVQRNTVIMVSPRLAADGFKMLGLPVLADPAQAIAAAAKALGPSQKRVIVFPAGGCTYPIVP